MTINAADVRCPTCQGPMWDETKSKFYDPTKNKPVAKCKDKQCDGVIWPPRNGAAPARPAAPAPATANAKAPHSSGGPPPWETDAMDAICTSYTVAYKHAASLARAEFGNDTSDTAVAAMAATIFIQAAQKGALVG